MKFLPDAPQTTPTILVEVEAVPTVRGYAGPPSLVSAGYANIGAECTGAALLFKLDGSTRLIAGTTTRLYEGGGGSWTDVSRGANYSTGDVRWTFAQFGNTTFASNKSTQLQSSTSGAFADVANAPKCALLETVGGFLFAANTDDTGTGLTTGYGDQEHRWWCSPLFAPTTTWAPSITTQANTGLLVSSPGGIKAARRLGDQIALYKDRAIHVGTYVGPPEVWRFDQVPGEVGCQSNSAVISIGSAHLFVGYEDFYLFDGSRPVAIGEGVREWFFDRLDKQYAYLITGAHDRNNSSVWWWYPVNGETTLDQAIIYNYKTQTWGHASIPITIPLLAITSGISYDNLGASFTTYEDLPNISYDSPFWQSSSPVMAVFDQSDDLYTLTGASTSSYVQTGLLGAEGMYSFCSRVRALYGTKPTAANITAYQMDEAGTILDTNETTSVNGDRFDVLQSARWHAFRLSFTGPTEVQKITPYIQSDGEE